MACSKLLNYRVGNSNLTVNPSWKIDNFLSEVSVCWSCTEKITIKIERAFSVTLRASPAIRLQLPAVAVTSSSWCNLWQLSYIRVPEVVSKCQTGKLFPSHRRMEVVSSDRMVQLYYYNNIWKVKPKRSKQPDILLASGAAPVQCFQNCFKSFQVVSNCYYVKSAASLSPNNCYMFDKQSWCSIQYLIAAN